MVLNFFSTITSRKNSCFSIFIDNLPWNRLDYCLYVTHFCIKFKFSLAIRPCPLHNFNPSHFTLSGDPNAVSVYKGPKQKGPATADTTKRDREVILRNWNLQCDFHLSDRFGRRTYEGVCLETRGVTLLIYDLRDISFILVRRKF